MERIQNFPYALRMLLRLLEDFPETASRADAYYHLFLLYGRMENDTLAQVYRDSLIAQFPEDKNAIRVANPNYEQIARYGKHIEDSLYAATYEAYQASHYDTVATNFDYHTANFAEGRHRGRIMFLRAMTYLYTGQQQGIHGDLPAGGGEELQQGGSGGDGQLHRQGASGGPLAKR